MDTDTPPETGAGRLKAWLAAPVTVTLPGWGIAAGAVAIVVLLIVALD